MNASPALWPGRYFRTTSFLFDVYPVVVIRVQKTPEPTSLPSLFVPSQSTVGPCIDHLLVQQRPYSSTGKVVHDDPTAFAARLKGIRVAAERVRPVLVEPVHRNSGHISTGAGTGCVVPQRARSEILARLGMPLGSVASNPTEALPEARDRRP
jgi:hypothetical protein